VTDPQTWIEEGGILGLVICALIFIIIQCINALNKKDKEFISSLGKKDKTFCDNLEQKDHLFVNAIQEQRNDSKSYIVGLLETNKSDKEIERKLNQDTHDKLAKAIDNLTHELQRKSR
jgi:hypothetical protein